MSHLRRHRHRPSSASRLHSFNPSDHLPLHLTCFSRAEPRRSAPKRRNHPRPNTTAANVAKSRRRRNTSPRLVDPAARAIPRILPAARARIARRKRGGGDGGRKRSGRGRRTIGTEIGTGGRGAGARGRGASLPGCLRLESTKRTSGRWRNPQVDRVRWQ